jgi:hypothetical protein
MVFMNTILVKKSRILFFESNSSQERTRFAVKGLCGLLSKRDPEEIPQLIIAGSGMETEHGKQLAEYALPTYTARKKCSL